MTEPYLHLAHDPLGPGDFYNPNPTERTPHLPVVGQPLSLGAATWPEGVVHRVWAEWEIESGPRGTAEAAPVTPPPAAETTVDEGNLAGLNANRYASYAGRSLWQVSLPPLSNTGRLSYRLHAEGPGGRIKTEEFACEVAAWQPAGDVVEVEQGEGGLLLRCASGGDPMGSVQISFPAPGVLRVRHLSGSVAAPPAKSGAPWGVIADEPDHLLAGSESAHVRINRAPFRLSLLGSEGEVLLEDAEGPAALADRAGRVYRHTSSFASPPDEAFFGFGERFNALNQRGQVLDSLVYEQYKSQGKRTYIPVPFFISSRGYGLYLATSAYVRYDLAASAAGRWSLEVEMDPEASSAGLEYDFFVGAPREIIAAFTSMTAKPALPPEWAFGLWMSGNEWNDQATVMEQVRLHEVHQIPAAVMVIEAWSDETTFYVWNDAQYIPKPPYRPPRYDDFTFPPEGKWPDPQAMIDDLHARGIKLVLWQIPAMKKVEEPHPQHEADVAYMLEHRYCVQDASGEPHRIRPFWFRGGLVVDFTRPGAEEWWLSKRAYLVEDMGVDGFKTDGGEHLWGGEFVFADGSRGTAAANRFPVLYTGAFHRLASKGGREGVTFSRAGFTGCQAYPCHWAGDENSTWAAFRASILAGLSAGASGIPFWGWDIGGFSGPLPSAELYLRATAMSCFCPIMQYHSELNEHRRPLRDRTPWNVQEQTGDPDVIPVFREYAQLRVRLLPYIYAEARKASESGVPMMRALPIEFPGDRRALDFPFQYMFGDALLVAPVVQEGVTRQEVYLPEGEWRDFWTGEPHAGRAMVEVDAPKDRIPVFVRNGLEGLLPFNFQSERAS